MNSVEYLKTKCAICRTYDNSREIYPEQLDDGSASVQVFSARRIPDRRYYRWVSCDSCGLYRSDPILNINLDELYKKSSFDYLDETKGLKLTYGKIVRKALKPDSPSGHILEIGGGNGFFLEKALEMGFASIEGVEPSESAVGAALPHIKKHMKISMFDRNVVKDETADVIAIFHTLDHLTDPLLLIQTAFQNLKPGGRIVIAVHNSRAFSAKLLKSRSPIFDIEHTYLFSKTTLSNLLSKAGYADIKVNWYANSYSLAYIVHLIPISKDLKKFILMSSFGKLLSLLKVRIPLGNIWASARKPF